MSENSVKTKSVLSFFNLSDAYERKARLAPGVLTIALLLPAAIALSVPLSDWIKMLLAGTGLGAVIAIGISHLASAMGNRYQEKLWPRWPHDAPTNRRLHPTDTTRSRQQKHQWYAAIRRLTSLDIAAIGNEEGDQLDAIINDAVTQIRTRLWKSTHAERLRLHNTDYGFARNFAGLAPVWLGALTAATIACWVGFYFGRANLGWSVGATILSIVAYPLAFLVLPDYVRKKAEHYADSFFDALLSLDRAQDTAESESGGS